MTELPVVKSTHVSASQIKLRNDCERKYLFEKVLEVLPRSDGSVATRLGSQCHEIWEEYLKNGTIAQGKHTPAELIAYHMLDLIPLPNDGMEIEREMKIPVSLDQPLEMLGYIDVWIPDQGRVADALPDLEPLGPLDGVPLVHDHKTSSNPLTREEGGWGLSNEDLLSDVQAVTYAKWAILETGAEFVDLRWAYSGTKKRIKRYAQVRMREDMVHQAYAEHVLPVIHRIAETREKTDQHDCDWNLSSCGKFGGCRYAADFCRLPEVSDEEMIEAKFGKFFND